MKVRVLFFGATADATSAREIEFNAETNEKASEVFRRIVAAFPALEKHKLLFALNQEYAGGEETVKNGDELAVFTAVSGG